MKKNLIISFIILAVVICLTAITIDMTHNITIHDCNVYININTTPEFIEKLTNEIKQMK